MNIDIINKKLIEGQRGATVRVIDYKEYMEISNKIENISIQLTKKGIDTNKLSFVYFPGELKKGFSYINTCIKGNFLKSGKINVKSVNVFRGNNSYTIFRLYINQELTKLEKSLLRELYNFRENYINL